MKLHKDAGGYAAIWHDEFRGIVCEFTATTAGPTAEPDNQAVGDTTVGDLSKVLYKFAESLCIEFYK